MAETKTKKTVFSGVQPTGDLHIGNLIGAISLWVREQDKHDNIFCVVDLHALTMPEAITAERLRANSLDVAALYVACGIDPDRSIIFLQSQVRQHAELAWILNCVTPMGWMNRMTQFKSKSEKGVSGTVGLYSYPILQAADILLYHTDLVPVGEDQRQHIEITQDIAERFERLFGYHFTRPEIMVQQVGARVMGLDDPEAKMSKSSTNPKPRHLDPRRAGVDPQEAQVRQDRQPHRGRRGRSRRRASATSSPSTTPSPAAAGTRRCGASTGRAMERSRRGSPKR